MVFDNKPNGEEDMKENIKKEFPMLQNFLTNSDLGLRIVSHGILSEQLTRAERSLPALRHDFLSTQEAEDTKQHNLRWAKGEEASARLLLSWIMLPTVCNQRCRGCYAGNDKKELGRALPQFYPEAKLDQTLDCLKRHGVKIIGYAGLGELFTMRRPAAAMSAREYISHILRAGFNMLIFTNGTLLTAKDVDWLAERDVSLIFSLRDIVESEHNRLVGIKGFRRSLRGLDFALRAGLHKENRIGVEIPVIHSNMERVLQDFIPAMRHLGVIPYAEQYMQVRTSPEEKVMGLNFAETREFFERACARGRIDAARVRDQPDAALAVDEGQDLDAARDQRHPVDRTVAPLARDRAIDVHRPEGQFGLEQEGVDSRNRRAGL